MEQKLIFNETSTIAVQEKKIWGVGDKAEAKWTDGEYYYGEITRVFKSKDKKDEYAFRYDDGDRYKYVNYNILNFSNSLTHFLDL